MRYFMFLNVSSILGKNAPPLVLGSNRCAVAERMYLLVCYSAINFSDGAGLQGPWEILAHYIVVLWLHEYHISGIISVIVILLF